VFKRPSNILLAALLLTTETHWAVLQSIAWMGMVATYSRKAPLAIALKETFDGKHPCPLCKAIATTKKSEKKNGFTLQTKKFEFPPVTKNFPLVAPARFQSLPGATDAFAESLTQKPPTPPPRSFFV
jgi:hypothetical protein